MRKQYPGITLFKLIGALLVLMGHVHIPELYKEYGRVAGLQQASAFVVPCFYMISGFLACKGWRKAARPQAYIRHYLGWLAGIYAVLCAVAQLTGTGLQAQYAPGAWHNAVLPLARLYGLFPPYPALWFVPPLLVGVAFCYYFQRRGQLRWALALTVAGFVGAQLLSGTLRAGLEASVGTLSFYNWRYAELLTLAAVNYLGFACPFILAGVLIACHEAAFAAWPAKWLATAALGSMALEFLVLHWLVRGPYTYNLILSIVPLGIWLFYGLLRIKSKVINRYQAPIGRFSGLMYFLHMPMLVANAMLMGVRTTSVCLWQQPLPLGSALALMLLTTLEVAGLTWALGWRQARRANLRPVAEVAVA
jgi:hypothetical protein